MHDRGHSPTLHWNHDAIAAAAAAAGIDDLESHLGFRLSSAPTAAEISMLVSSLPIGYASTVAIRLPS